MEQEKWKKKTIRIAPYNRFDLKSMEQYLSVMAKKGLLIKHLGFFSVFEKSEPKAVIYRIDPMQEQYSVGDEDHNAEQCAAYNEQGWTFVTTYARMFMIYKKEQETLGLDTNEKEVKMEEVQNPELKPTNEQNSVIKMLPELNQNHLPLTDTYTYKKLNSRLNSSSLSEHFILSFFLIWILPRWLFLKQWTIFDMITTNFVIYIPYFFILLVIMSIGDRRKRYHITRLSLSYETGCELQDTRTKKDFLSSIGDGMYIFLLVSMCFVLLFGVGKEPVYHELSDYSGTLPCLSLEQVEQTKKEVVEEGSVSHMYNDLSNYYTSQSSFLVPVQLEISETMYPKNDSSDTTASHGRSYMYTKYYELRFQRFTSTFFREMLNQNLELMQKENLTLKKLNTDGNSQFYYIKTDDRQYITGYYNNKVIWIAYQGNKDLDNMYPLLDILPALRGCQKMAI
ncbi:MAG: DUF2812 domain-containing protein [Clostridiales bacterium]|nr:DUF2812 domain-containing protein [Clostridiales bacterium]